MLAHARCIFAVKIRLHLHGEKMAKYIVFWTLEKNYSIITQPCLKSTKPGDTTEGKFMGKIYPCIVIKSKKIEIQQPRDSSFFISYFAFIQTEEHVYFRIILLLEGI